MALFWLHRHVVHTYWKLTKKKKKVLNTGKGAGKLNSLLKIMNFKCGKYCWMCAERAPSTGCVLCWHCINQNKIHSQVITLPEIACFIFILLSTRANIPAGKGPEQLAVYYQENTSGCDLSVLHLTVEGSSFLRGTSTKSLCGCCSWGSNRWSS